MFFLTLIPSATRKASTCESWFDLTKLLMLAILFFTLDCLDAASFAAETALLTAAFVDSLAFLLFASLTAVLTLAVVAFFVDVSAVVAFFELLSVVAAAVLLLAVAVAAVTLVSLDSCDESKP